MSADVLGGIDYGKLKIVLYEQLQKLEILAEGSDVSVDGGSTVYLPDSGGVDVSSYKTKSVLFWTDWGDGSTSGFQVEYQISDDGTFTDNPALKTVDKTTANTLDGIQTQMEFKYLRIKVYNPDSVSHTVKKYSIKGRMI